VSFYYFRLKKLTVTVLLIVTDTFSDVGNSGCFVSDTVIVDVVKL